LNSLYKKSAYVVATINVIILFSHKTFSAIVFSEEEILGPMSYPVVRWSVGPS